MTDLDGWRYKYDHWRLSGPPDDSDHEGQRSWEDYETERADDHYSSGEDSTMKTYTKVVREGELLGPVDWSYDFTQHDWNHGGGCNPELVAQAVEVLKRLVAIEGRAEALLSHRDSWARVLAVGMYDGWPHWRPVPSIRTMTRLGSLWHDFFWLRDVRKVTA